MKVLLFFILTAVIKVCCNSESGTCCRDYGRLSESVSSLLIRVNDLEVENRRLKINSHQMQKEIKKLKKLSMKPKCPEEFKQIRHSCYLLVTNEKTRHHAARYCKNTYGSHLVRIQSKGEIERLTDYLEKEKDVPSILYTMGYLNGSLTAGTGGGSANWVWSKSKPLIFSVWNKLGDPPVKEINDQTATCTVLVKTGTDWVLKSEYCKEKRAFICEKRKARLKTARRIRH